MLASTYPLLDIFWTMLEIFLFVVWFFLLFVVLMDVFRSRDIGGVAKALWVVFIIVLPLLGVLVYLIARGGSMHERSVRRAQQQEQAFQSYVRQAAGPPSTTDELARLGQLRDRGVITPEELEQAKAKVLGSAPAAGRPTGDPAPTSPDGAP